MTKREVVSLAMKLLAVYFLMMTLPFFLALLFDGQHSLPKISLPIGIAGMSCILLFGNKIIARLLIPDDDTTPVTTHLLVSDWQAILFSAIGVSVVIKGVQSLVTRISYIPQAPFSHSLLVPSFISISIGVLLFFQARGLANLWKFFQDKRKIGE